MADDFRARTSKGADAASASEKPPQCQNVSPAISAIIWARQLSKKIESNLAAAKSLFRDVPALQRLVSVA